MQQIENARGDRAPSENRVPEQHDSELARPACPGVKPGLDRLGTPAPPANFL